MYLNICGIVCGRYNTSVHRQEYSTKMLLLVLSIKTSTIKIRLRMHIITDILFGH